MVYVILSPLLYAYLPKGNLMLSFESLRLNYVINLL